MPSIYQVDAFTDRPFAGNPAAVCVLDASKGHAELTDAWLQQVAAETPPSIAGILKTRILMLFTTFFHFPHLKIVFYFTSEVSRVNPPMQCTGQGVRETSQSCPMT